ncbi:MAG TPA: tellurite resistance/C4-dicarboxylate transporter family protein, partial [Cyclobacteriaceae bacterium]|nr:tellurite resistance/C4-dicarboxylate transporter family protein [Cyclobacteriaceae bacterium]
MNTTEILTSATGSINYRREKFKTMLAKGIKELLPGYFAMVMATGIISLAAYFQEINWLAYALFAVNILFYIVLVILLIARLIFFMPDFLNDFSDFSRGTGFFTTIAGTCILGNQFVVISGKTGIGFFLWFLSLFIWIILIYGIFTAFLVRENKPPLEKGINGSWLVSIVATQAVSVLGALLSSRIGDHREEMLFFSLTLWLFGGMLYIWIIMLIFQRYLFHRLEPSDLTPPYWINMGAVAITTLAGDILISQSGNSGILLTILPFIKGFTLFFWATATWWIPMLFVLGIWRHVFRKYKLSYDPQYWGAVFPLGMYTACTHRLSEVMHIEFLSFIPVFFIYIAIAAWILTFIGLLNQGWGGLKNI